MICALSEKQIANLYTYVYKVMLKEGDKFNPESFMQTLFDDLSKAKDIATASKFIQHVPKIILSISLKKDLDYIESSTPLKTLRQNFNNPVEGLENVIKHFNKKVNAADTADMIKIVNEQNQEIPVDTEPIDISEVIQPKNFKPLTAMSGLLSVFKPVNPELKESDIAFSEELDETRLAMMDLFQTLADISLENPTSPYFNYKGEDLALHVMPISKFKGLLNYMDPESKNDNNKKFILTDKNENALKYEERNVVVVTNPYGYIVTFDKNGNVYTDAKRQPNTFMLFQYLRNVKNNKIYDFDGKQEKLISPVEFAKTYKVTIPEAEVIIQESIEELQSIIDSIGTAKNNQVLVNFEGLSLGIPSGEVSKVVPFKLFIESKKADLSVLKSMTNQLEDTAEFKQGTTTIRINDQSYKLDRLHLPDEIAQQISDVVFSKDLDTKTKYTFVKQFIPFNTTFSKIIIGESKNENDTLKLTVFTDTTKKAQEYNIAINEDFLNKLDPASLSNYKEKFLKALTTAWSNKGMPLAYRPELFDGNGTYLSFENNQLVPKSYYDFILNLNPYLYTSTLPDIFVSKQVLFSKAENKPYQKPAINIRQKIATTSAEPVTYDSLLSISKNEKYVSYALYNNIQKAVNSGEIASREELQKIIDDWQNAKSFIGNPYLSESQLSGLESLLNKLPGENQVTDEQTDEYYEDSSSEAEKDIQFNNDINPVENTPNDYDELDRAGYTVDNVTEEQLIRANEFWYNTAFGKMLQKHINLTHATNLANSNVFAKFFISGATLANPDNLATIALNTNKGTFVDIYHEAWHAFSQLYLTKQQKIDLYNEVKNFKDASGKQPYKNLNFFQIEEMIAEDFRTYMKSENRLDNRPKRNSLFKRILNFLKALFGKKQSNAQEFMTGVMEVPVINEWFKNLNFNSNNPEVFKDYKPLINNMLFSKLDRGITSVFKKNESVLSDEDSILISDSLDMIMSSIMNEQVDKQVAKGANVNNLQSAALALLLNKKNRSKLYADALDVLKSRLEFYQNQYQKFNNVPLVSSFKTDQELKDKAVAVIKSDKGNKYVLLKSQVDNFKNLRPDIKRGDRIKGEDWHGIRIVGDYYDFIPETGKPVGVIVVSDVKDAQIQYDNYVKGGALKYTGVEIKNDSLPALNEEQEILLDKIKILEKAVDNFGDPEWELKGEAPKGVIAYHLKNSSFELSKKSIEIDAENEEEDADSIEEKDAEIFNDNKTGKQSVLQLAQKEVIYILNSISKIENGKPVLNKLGFPEKAEFRNLWNILAKTTGGIRDRQIAYDKLLEAAKIHPEIKQLMDYKYPNPKATNKYAVQLSFAFFHTFSLPPVNYKQLTVFTKDQEGEDKRSFVVTDSSLENSSTIKKFSAYFNSQPVSNIIKKNAENTNYLDIDNFLKEFSKNNYFDKGNAGEEKTYKFLETLGIKLDPTTEVKNMMLPANIDKFINANGVSVIYNIVKDFQRIQDNLANATTEEKTYLSKFLLNPVEVLSKPIPKSIVTGKVKDVSGYIKKLANIQVQYGFDSANPGVLLPDGNKVFANVNHSLLSTIITDLNNLENLSQIRSNPVKYGHLSYLLDTDSFVVQVDDEYKYRSKILSHLFDEYGNKKANKSLEFLFTAGTQIADTSGINTSDLDVIGKNFQEFYTTLLAGVAELTRAAEKKSAFGIKPLGKIEQGVYNNIIKPESDNHWVNLNMFTSKYKNTAYSNGEIFSIGYYLLPHLAAEFDRVREFRNNPALYEKVIGFNRKLPSGKMAGEEFSLFAKMLSEKTKKDLYDLVKSPSKLEDILEEEIGLRNNIIKDILFYFNKSEKNYTERFFNNMPIKDDSLYSLLGLPEEQLKNIDKTELDKILVKAFLYNDFISKVESFTLFTGDLAQYNHSKEEASKRIPGASSDGKIPVTDQAAYDYINDAKGFNAVTYAGQQQKENSKIQLLNIQGTFNSAVIKDAIRTSVYLPEISNALYEDYYKNRPELSKKEIDDLVAKDIKAYTDMKESDGAAYLTFDAYRAIKKLFNDWTEEQDKLYLDIVNGVEIPIYEFNKTFPVSKLHYYGPLANTEFKKLNARAMHKFAVAPINPLIAVPGTALYDLHNWMLEQNIQYTMFGSGSKATTLSLIGLDEKGKPAFDDIFADEKQALIKPDAKVQNNKIYLNYFKEVTAIAAKFKKEITIPTQKRVLILDALFDAGDLKNSSNKEVVDQYKKTVNSYTSILKTQLLNKIGYKLDEKGNYTGKLNKFVELVREELELKDTPEHLVKLLDVTLNNDLTIDFSIHPESDLIEKIIVNKIQKTIVKQKTKGEALVQVPTTFTNGIWDNLYKMEKDIDKILKYVGTNTLAFYKRGDIINKKTGERAVTNLMKVAVALQGDFKNLLNLQDPANPGNTIGTIDRLNELVKDDEWLKENKDLITIGGPRIPTDAVNSIEAAEIWHFLPESFGNTVVVPTEIVAKAGSDYDADKIFFMFPNINSDGSLVKSVETEDKTFDEILNELNILAEDKTYKGVKPSAIIEQQKKYLQNELIKNTRSIIELPDNYVSLVKPNEMYLVKDHVQFFRESADYNPKNKIHDAETEKDEYEEMPGTTALEFEYNLSKFEQNLSGNLPLSILAKKNKWHTLMKTIGFILPKTYKKIYWDVIEEKYKESNVNYDMVFRLPVNRTPEGNVSISNEYNVDNVKIGDVFSHALQGVLDRAKDPWPFLVQMVTEALPVMNHYLEAGASVPSVLKMMKSPLVDDYIRNQVYYGSPIAELAHGKLSKSDIKKFSIKPLLYSFDTYKDELRTKIQDLKIDEIKNNLKDTDELTIIYNGKRYTLNKQKFLSSNLINNNIEKIEINGRQAYYKINPVINIENLLIGKANYYHAAQAAWELAFPNDTVSEKTLSDLIINRDRTSLQSLAVLLHIVQAEEQFSGQDELEMAFNPDTGVVDTTLQIINRKDSLNKLEQTSKIDKASLKKLMDHSIVSSFFQNDLILDLVNNVFPLKLNETVLDFLKHKLNKESKIISKVFGEGLKGRDRFINAFNNGLVNYIFQNYRSNMLDKSGNITLLPNFYKHVPILESNTYTEDAVLENGTIKVNLTKIQEDYKNLRFINDTSRDSFKITENPFSNINEYVKYLVIKQYLKSVYTIDNLVNNPRFQTHLANNGNNPEKAYEVFLSERSLMNAFNRAYIMGTTKYKYTDQVLEVINNPQYNLKEKYSVLNNLSKATTVKTGSILQLDNKDLAKGNLATVYYKNLKQLGDLSVRKTINPEQNKYITDLFQNFSLFMFYQHGVGYSPLGFTKIYDPEKFVKFMKIASNNFIEQDLNPDSLNNIFNKLLDKTQRFKNYLQSETDEGVLAKIKQSELESVLDYFSTDDLERRYKEGTLGSLTEEYEKRKALEKLQENEGSIKTTQPTTAPVSTGFQGYKGGFENVGKGTPQGDGKDKAMRAVATSSIVEIKSDKRPSSSMTTLENVGTDNDYSYEKDRYIGSSYNGSLPAFSGIGIMNNFGTTVMLARNGELKNLPLSDETKRLINIANQQGVSFVVGDMPGIDSQFIDYLQEIGAKFTVYHTGNTPRIQITQPSAPITEPTVSTTNNPAEYTNYHGGAEKYDKYWEEEGKSFGVTNHTVYDVKSYDALDKTTKDKLENRYQSARTWLGRGNVAADSYSGKLVRRDMMQAAKADAIFAISEIVAPGTKGRKGYVNKTNHPIVEGGTGYAVASGIMLNKPVYVFNQDSSYGYETGWYKWDSSTNNFVKTDTPTLTKNYAGIGSHTNETEIGRQAIRDVYANTFKAATQSQTDIQGINISSKSSDKLGRELTNPNWGAKNIMDIEAEYKANASKIKAPNLNAAEALKYDMNLMYKLQMKKFKAHPELVQAITDRGGIKFLEASEHTVGVKDSRWEGKGTKSNFIKVLIKSYQDSLATTQPSTSVKPTVKDLTRWSDLKDATTPYTSNGIVVTRISNTEEHFGNPFIGSQRRDKNGNLVKSKVDNITVFNTIDEADQAYRDWLMGAKHQNIQPLRREWILKQINEGKLDGKTLLYYKPMEVTNNDGTIVRGGYHSHADTLAEIVEELRGKTTTQPTQSTVRKTYSGKVTSLQPNQIFVFGSNPLGINGNPAKGTGGAALVAYNIAGVKQGEKMDNKLSDSGKAWGITTVTGPGKKRSKTPQEITEGIKKLYEFAKQNPTKEFLVSDYSATNLNGYTGQEMANMFTAAGPIPSNIVFNENFDKLVGTTQPTVQPVGEVKEGVVELFESNPELANAVYEDLGFTGAISLKSNLKNTGKTEQDLIDYLKKKYPEIKLNITNNPVWEKGPQILNQQEYNNEVAFRIKTVDLLTSRKADEIFAKGLKNKWPLDKMLTELQVPKLQKQLIDEVLKNMIYFDGIPFNAQIAYAIASTYNYTVEINVATKNEIGVKERYNPETGEIDIDHVEPDIDYIEEYDEEGNIIGMKPVLSKKGKKQLEEKPTQYYSNLTVPGGTNYTEQEIATPGITPSIKGHAKFATDQGIGWFRSDEQASFEEIDKYENKRIEKDTSEITPWDNESENYIRIATINGKETIIPGKVSKKDAENWLANANLKRFKVKELTKTRRILEVQSDLFQKGRDKKILSGSFKAGETGMSEQQQEELALSYQLDKEPENQFLQLLNKDNNWVTFFVKSIIQDSAKKGYEKVLFPSGDTASKVEGHTTLEEFKKQKEDRIKQLEEDIKQEIKPINNKYVLYNYDAGFSEESFSSLAEAVEFQKSNSGWYFKEEDDSFPNRGHKISEIETLKQELKRVETEGFGALRPIWNFYENTVTNVLNKQFGKNSVKQVTDEYGNTWNEVTIDQTRDLQNVLLQKNEAGRIIGQANIQAMSVLIDAVNKKEDTLPHEYAHHYIAWFRNTPLVQEGIKRWGSEEALVQAIGEQVVKQKGEAWNWWKKFTNFIINLLSDKQLLQVLTDSFLNRTDLSSDFTYNQITPQQKQQALQLYSQYLDTIFPDSKVKDIVYHGTDKQFEKFISDNLGSNTKAEDADRGFAFTANKNTAKTYGKNIKAALLNAYNIETVSPLSEQYEDIIKPEFPSLKKQILDLKKLIESQEKVNSINRVEDLPNSFYTYSEKIKSLVNIVREGSAFYAYVNGKKINDKLTDKQALAQFEKTKKDTTELTKKLNLLTDENTVFVYKNIIDDRNIESTSRSNIYFAKPNQIHILGNKQDIEGFKEFVKNNPEMKRDTPIQPEVSDQNDDWQNIDNDSENPLEC